MCVWWWSKKAVDAVCMAVRGRAAVTTKSSLPPESEWGEWKCDVKCFELWYKDCARTIREEYSSGDSGGTMGLSSWMWSTGPTL